MAQACSTTKTLQVAFTAPSIIPTNGYIVKWRKVGDVSYTTVSPNPVASPVNIAAVPACDNIEGTIQTNCGAGNTGTIATFFATGIGYTPDYTLVRTTSCVTGVGNTSYALTGHIGDTVVLKFTMNGVVAWNNTDVSGAGTSCTLTAQSISNSGSSSHITGTTATTASTCNATVTITMATTSLVVNTVAIINNSTVNNIMSGNLEIVSINGNTSTISTASCIGISTGSW